MMNVREMLDGHKDQVLIKKYRRLYLGSVKKGKFIEDRELKSMNDIETSDFKTLDEWILLNGEKPKVLLRKEILQNFSCGEIYFRVPKLEPKATTSKAFEKEWEKYWFSKNYELCNKCTGKCKQSSHLKYLHCPDFKEKK
jgi:hypothetical protein